MNNQACRIEEKLAKALPDIPRWIETRSMLLSGRCEVRGLKSAGETVFIVLSHETGLMVVVGRPDLQEIAACSELGCETVLTTVENAGYVSRALPEWRAVSALLHLPGDKPLPAPDTETRLISIKDLEGIGALPETLIDELVLASRHSPVAAAFADGLPVSFCYAASLTEGLWDVSIDTLEPYRKRGFAEAAVIFMIDHMKKGGRVPVWGAEEWNLPSINLAKKLGFEVVDQLTVFNRRDLE